MLWPSNNLKSIYLGRQSCPVQRPTRSCSLTSLWPPCSKLGIDTNGQRQTTTSLLREQIIAGSRAPLPTTRKGHPSGGSSHMKASPLLPAHTIIVLTQLPLRSILWSADYTRRIAKWGTILGAFDIKYMPCTSVKGQVLADPVAEFAEPSLEEEAGAQDMDEKSIGAISLQGPTC